MDRDDVVVVGAGLAGLARVPILDTHGDHVRADESERLRWHPRPRCRRPRSAPCSTGSSTTTGPRVRHTYRERCDVSRRLAGQLELVTVVEGRGARPLWRIYVHMLRELAQHAGHADILREQILDRRSG